MGRIVAMLTDHDQAEHAALYPLARVVLADDALLQRPMIAHSAVKMAIDRLRQLEGPPLLDAVDALKALVVAHVADEETALLPAERERGLGTMPAFMDEVVVERHDNGTVVRVTRSVSD